MNIKNIDLICLKDCIKSLNIQYYIQSRDVAQSGSAHNGAGGVGSNPAIPTNL